MTNTAFPTLAFDDLETATGGAAIDIPPGSHPRSPWGPIVGRPEGTPPFIPRPTPTFPYPTGPMLPIGGPKDLSSPAARLRVEP